MKFATPSLFITLIISLSMMVDAAPVESKRQDQSLEIQGPTKDSTWVVGRSEAITWKTTSNQPVDIMLSKEESSDVIVVAKNLNGFQGSYVYTVPDSLFASDQSSDKSSSSSKWKILIKDNGQIFSTSEDFVISSSAPTEAENSVTPPAQATTQNHWAATASISLLGPDGKAISMSQTASSAGHYQTTSLSTLLLVVTLGGVFLGL
ncbi:hypothetical protein BCR42DRAFT_475632 [Absidia repens]|uniref:Ser-Thr-rich glycosyl-phosphatidyl-inositol-anchored membrane family-domain-containing protein n=1 Tax=Absidia repens TaxID=90262 RepID=A0A1X2HR41_9FUNG|nr:hypothetical protein BCR42DRAFT_475632 [Absidia repens]